MTKVGRYLLNRFDNDSRILIEGPDAKSKYPPDTTGCCNYDQDIGKFRVYVAHDLPPKIQKLIRVHEYGHLYYNHLSKEFEPDKIIIDQALKEINDHPRPDMEFYRLTINIAMDIQINSRLIGLFDIWRMTTAGYPPCTAKSWNVIPGKDYKEYLADVAKQLYKKYEDHLQSQDQQSSQLDSSQSDNGTPNSQGTPSQSSQGDQSQSDLNGQSKQESQSGQSDSNAKSQGSSDSKDDSDESQNSKGSSDSKDDNDESQESQSGKSKEKSEYEKLKDLMDSMGNTSKDSSEIPEDVQKEVSGSDEELKEIDPNLGEDDDSNQDDKDNDGNGSKPKDSDDSDDSDDGSDDQGPTNGYGHGSSNQRTSTKSSTDIRIERFIDKIIPAPSRTVIMDSVKPMIRRNRGNTNLVYNAQRYRITRDDIKLGVVIDVSGSMDTRVVKTALSSIYEIAHRLNPESKVILFSDHLRGMYDIKDKPNDIPIGGGTELHLSLPIVKDARLDTVLMISDFETDDKQLVNEIQRTGVTCYGIRYGQGYDICHQALKLFKEVLVMN